MLVSIDWLKDHISDKNIIILDTRPKTMFLYGHISKSQSLTIEQVIQFDQYGANLVIDEKKIIDLFNSLGIDNSKIVVLIGDSMDPSAARIAWTFLYFRYFGCGRDFSKRRRAIGLRQTFHSLGAHCQILYQPNFVV